MGLATRGSLDRSLNYRSGFRAISGWRTRIQDALAIRRRCQALRAACCRASPLSLFLGSAGCGLSCSLPRLRGPRAIVLSPLSLSLSLSSPSAPRVADYRRLPYFPLPGLCGLRTIVLSPLSLSLGPAGRVLSIRRTRQDENHKTGGWPRFQGGPAKRDRRVGGWAVAMRAGHICKALSVRYDRSICRLAVFDHRRPGHPCPRRFGRCGVSSITGGRMRRSRRRCAGLRRAACRRVRLFGLRYRGAASSRRCPRPTFTAAGTKASASASDHIEFPAGWTGGRGSIVPAARDRSRSWVGHIVEPCRGGWWHAILPGFI